MKFKMKDLEKIANRSDYDYVLSLTMLNNKDKEILLEKNSLRLLAKRVARKSSAAINMNTQESSGDIKKKLD